ncbi:DUF11 domain-containing protein [Nonomuraea antimicrobica]
MTRTPKTSSSRPSSTGTSRPAPPPRLRPDRGLACGGPGLTVPAGQSIAYEVPVTTDPALQDGLTLVSRAHVTASGTAGDQAELVTRARSAVDVELLMTAPPVVNSGEPITYTLTVVNHGPSRATDVTLRSPVAAGQAAITERPSECPSPGEALTCPVGALAPDERRTYTFGVTPEVTGVLENCATVTAAGREENPADNRSCADTQVRAPRPPAATPGATATPEPSPTPETTSGWDREGKAHGPGQEVLLPEQAPQQEQGRVRQAAGAAADDVPPPAPLRRLAPLTGASLWMLCLGVAVLLAIGLLVRYLSGQDGRTRQGRRTRHSRRARQGRRTS